MFSIENQDISTYLVYSIKSTDEIDSLSMGMLSNNKIKGVAPVLFTQMDTERYFKYNISAKTPASQFLSGAVTKKRLLSVMSNIAGALLTADEYMVDMSLFVLDTDYIFVDVSTCEVLTICLPIIGGEHEYSNNIGAFFRGIIFNTQFDQTENCDYVTKLINFFNSNSVFSLSDFKTLIDQLNVTGNSSVIPPKPPVLTTREPIKQASAPAPVPAPSPVEPAIDRHVKENPAPVSVTKNPVKINIPEQPNKKVNEKANENSQDKISLLYVLRHYSKENMDAYKAQKNNGSDKNEPSIAKTKKGKADKKEKSKTSSESKLPTGFHIPGKDTPIVQPDTSASKPSVSVNSAPQIPDYKVAQQPVAPQVKQQQEVVPSSFGETTILQKPGAASGDTTVLDVAQIRKMAAAPYLLRDKNGEKIYINKPRFRIGKEKSYVDYFVADNTAISRSHADIITSGNEYSIIDMNSTNHTFVNNEMIASGQEVKLHDGDSVRLANESFTFKVN